MPNFISGHLFGINYLIAQLFIVLMCSTFIAPVIAQDLSEYTLGSGDVIKITVYDENDLALETRLSDTGVFNYPFLGDIKATGLTIQQLEQKLINGLKPDYLIAPDVTVRIMEYRNFYITGEVKKPAAYPFSPGLTLRKAVSLAGGFTARASKTKLSIISDNDTSKKPVAATLDTSINPGDIITVEQSFF